MALRFLGFLCLGPGVVQVQKHKGHQEHKPTAKAEPQAYSDCGLPPFFSGHGKAGERTGPVDIGLFQN
jgi:hypothetical protein